MWSVPVIKSLFLALQIIFLTSVRNLQNYTISRLLETCYLCTSMGKLITKICWINLFLYFLFFTANKELKLNSHLEPSLEENQCYYAEANHQKIIKTVLYYNNNTATQRLILSTDNETNPGPVNPDKQQTKPKSDHLPSSICQLCNKTVPINSTRLVCIHCRSLVHLQCSSRQAILIRKNSRKNHKWVCENYHFKELPFSGLS